MSIINIYFTGKENSFVSSILLYYLIKFLKNNKKFKLTHVVNTTLKQKKISSVKSKIILFIYFFFNRKYFKRLCVLDSIRSRYKSLSQQAKMNEILFNNFDDFPKNKIKKKSILISCGGNTIFKKKFLKKFDICINYHHAGLPEFRGSYSNGLELYHNKLYAYFSWHYINEKIDRGHVFYKDKIKIKKKAKHMLFYDKKKIILASKKLKKTLLLAKASQKHKFLPSKKGHYYSIKYFRNLFNNLEQFSFAQIKKYSEIFGGFFYKGEFITRIKKNNEGIILSDCKIKICEVKYLPIIVYRIFRFFKLINKSH